MQFSVPVLLQLLQEEGKLFLDEGCYKTILATQ